MQKNQNYALKKNEEKQMCKLGKICLIVMKYLMNTTNLYKHVLRQNIIAVSTKAPYSQNSINGLKSVSRPTDDNSQTEAITSIAWIYAITVQS